MAWTNEAKNATSFTNETKNISAAEYLLQEIGDFLLLEDGGQIITAGSEGSSWTGEVRN